MGFRVRSPPGVLDPENMGAYKYPRELWNRKQSDVMRFLLRVRAWELRQLTIKAWQYNQKKVFNYWLSFHRSSHTSEKNFKPLIIKQIETKLIRIVLNPVHGKP